MKPRAKSILLLTLALQGITPANGQNSNPFDTTSPERVQAMTILGMNNAGHSLEATARVEAWLETQPGQSRAEIDPDGNSHYIADVVDGMPEVRITFNVNAAATIGTNKAQPSGSLGTNLTGQGVVVGVWDGGDVLLNHQEYLNGGISRVFDRDGTSQFGMSAHAGHVTGTTGAAGLNPASRGMAIASTIYTRDFADPDASMPFAAA